MFDELTALLDDTNRSSIGSVLITNFNFDGNFLLQHFLSASLKSSTPCLYISLLTPFTHLKHVQGKMGNTLKSPELSSTSPLMFLPLFASLSEQFFQNKPVSTVDQLCAMIQQQVIASPQMIIIEDLQILRHLLKFSDEQILRLQRKIRQLYPDAQVITQFSISDDENDDETFSTPLINMLKRIHDKHLFVRNLPTGATKDINGQVRRRFLFQNSQFFFFLVDLFGSIAVSFVDQSIYS